jgi:hypothetical protein
MVNRFTASNFILKVFQFSKVEMVEPTSLSCRGHFQFLKLLHLQQIFVLLPILLFNLGQYIAGLVIHYPYLDLFYLLDLRLVFLYCLIIFLADVFQAYI